MGGADDEQADQEHLRVKEQLVAVFDRASSTYDDVGVDFFARWGRRLVEVSAIGPGDRVLDVGCGTGAVTVPAAMAVGSAGHVLGLDLAEGMLRRCRDECELRSLHHVEVRPGDAEDPGVAPGAFDAVLVGLVMFFLPDPGRALQAYRAALVGGGTLALSTFGPEDERFGPVFAAIAAHVPPGPEAGEAPTGAGPDDDDDGAPSRRNPGPFATAAGIEEILGRNRFDSVRHVEEASDVAFRDAGQWIDWSWSHGARALWESVPEDSRSAARDDAVTALAALADPTGGLVQRWTLRYTTARAG